MKLNKFKFVDKFKYLVIIPIILLITSIVIFAIFGLNYDYDFIQVSNFTVKFNTTVTEEEYVSLEEGINSIVANEKVNDYRLQRVGEGAQNGILIKIANEEHKLDSTIVTLKSNLESNLVDSLGDKITSSVVITTTDTEFSLPMNVDKMVLLMSVAILCIVVFVFAYSWIRYNFVASCSNILTILLEIVMLTSVMIVARVPFNYYFAISYFVMIASTIFTSTVINNHIKNNLNVEKYSKYSNAERVYDSVYSNLWNLVIFYGLILLAIVGIMFFGFNISMLYTAISTIIGLIVSIFFSIFIGPSLWSFWYEKEADRMLRRRLEIQKKKTESKPNDDIVV